MKSTKVGIATLFVIGLTLIWLYVDFPVPEEDEVEIIVHEMVEEPHVVDPEEMDVTTWTTSREHFVIDVPVDWDVVQKDAGGLSKIMIYPGDRENDVGIEIELSASRSISGTPIDFATWMNEQLVDADKLDFCTTKVLGGINVDCVVAFYDEDSEFNLFGEVDPLTYVFVRVQRIDEYELLFDSILATIDFNPDEETLEAAQVIQ